VLEACPKVGVVYGDIAMIDPEGRRTSAGGNVRRNGRPPQGNELIPLLEENFLPAATTIARRAAWADALPVPEHLGFADWYLTVAMARRWDFHYVDAVLADYRIHGTNMHRSMIRDHSGERTVFYVLDRLFAPPMSEQLTASQRSQRSRIYAANYKSCADRYFGSEMDADAQRCYLEALRHRPQLLLNPGIARRLAATLIGRARYERAKAALRAGSRRHPARA
jgi:hypothetical protein